MEVSIVDLLNIDDDEIHTKFSIYNLGGPALLRVEAREEDLLATSGFTENGSYTVVIALQRFRAMIISSILNGGWAVELMCGLSILS
jgi:hypothetical protein